MVLPNISYCINVWSHANVTNIRQLCVIYNRICRNVLLVKQRAMPAESLYSELDWLNLHQTIKFHLSILAYKFINCLLSYELRYPTFTYTLTQYPLRNNSNFRLPMYENLYSSQSITYRSSKIWNSLPEHIRNSNSLSALKKI